MKLICSLTFLIFLCVNVIRAQEETGPVNSPKEARKERAYAAIQNLKEGVLVVRLQSNARKIKALEALTKDPDNAKAKRAQKLLEQTIAETGSDNRAIREAFLGNYNFSKVQWMYDTATTLLANGATSGFLLNDSLEVDPSIQLASPAFLTLRIGYTDPSVTTGAESLIFTDQRLEDLADPFPYSFLFNPVNFALNKILDPQKAFQANIRKQVARINKKLKQFYKSSI